MTERVDYAVVGAGVAGTIFLKHLKSRGHNATLLERASTCGGLWRDVPPWQDIQVRKQDWAVNGLPLHGVDQKSIQQYIEAWVDRYQLGPFIRYNSPVTRAERVGERWVVHTPSGQIDAKFLVLSSGGHNVPRIPLIQKTAVQLEEHHSFGFRYPEQIKGKRVTIVGGSASAYDLVDLAIEHKASEIRWVCRGMNWMIPTTQAKHEKGGIRDLAIRQMRGGSPEQISRFFDDLFRKKYAHFKLEKILPDYRFDIERHNIIPGRPLLIKNFEKLKIHRGTIEEIHGKTVTCAGEKWETDLLLYGTGYDVDLSYLGLSKLAEIRSIDELRKHCGSYMISLDYPNLFFFAPTILDSNSVTPFICNVLARSLLAHIEGKISLPLEPITKNINHWHILEYLSKYDRRNYPPWWKLKYRLLAEFYFKFQKIQVRL